MRPDSQQVIIKKVSDETSPERELNWVPMWSGILASLIIGAAVYFWFASQSPKEAIYGLSLFTFVPGIAGVAAGIVTNWKYDHRTWVCWAVSSYSYGVATAILLLLTYEGVICMVLAAPLVIPLHAFGYYLGSEIMASKRTHLMVTVVPLLFAAMTYQARQTPAAETRTETTSIEIDATPEQIWPLLFELPSISTPTNILFRAGIAHPTATHSAGQFVGAARECVLTTGTMNERIVAIEPGKRLEFEVLNTPPSMHEMNPFGEVHAQHLKGYYTVHQGEFQLIRLANGRTRLVGTSVYSFKIYPAHYWAIWTDTVVEQIHLRVMSEIKQRAEAAR